VPLLLVLEEGRDQVDSDQREEPEVVEPVRAVGDPHPMEYGILKREGNWERNRYEVGGQDDAEAELEDEEHNVETGLTVGKPVFKVTLGD